MSTIKSSFKTFKVGTMVMSSQGMGKVIDVEMIRSDLGGYDPLHSILMNGTDVVLRTVNDLEPTKCTEEHRWDQHMKWCQHCTSEELGRKLEQSVQE